MSKNSLGEIPNSIPNRRFEQQRVHSDFVIRVSFVIGYLGVSSFLIVQYPNTPSSSSH